MGKAKQYTVIGFDPSLSNWGVVKGTLTIHEGGAFSLFFSGASVVKTTPKKPTSSTPKNIHDLARAKLLNQKVKKVLSNADMVFVELPTGSQSSRASVSYGICQGIIGSIKADGVRVIPVTPSAVKKSMTGLKDACKLEVIKSVLKRHPEIKFKTRKMGGKDVITLSEAEHIADAVGAIYAGLTPSFISTLKD